MNDKMTDQAERDKIAAIRKSHDFRDAEICKEEDACGLRRGQHPERKTERHNTIATLLAHIDALEAERTSPIPMVLFCPKCGFQHVDAPEAEIGWTNPPHKSHLCHKCKTVWRPADVATNGVACIRTKGSADTFNLHEASRTSPGNVGLVERLKHAVDFHLNENLCGMKSNCDDSITGFNEAWQVVDAVFKIYANEAAAALYYPFRPEPSEQELREVLYGVLAKRGLGVTREDEIVTRGGRTSAHTSSYDFVAAMREALRRFSVRPEVTAEMVKAAHAAYWNAGGCGTFPAIRAALTTTIKSENCPGHTSLENDKKCSRCGLHIDDLRPLEENIF